MPHRVLLPTFFMFICIISQQNSFIVSLPADLCYSCKYLSVPQVALTKQVQSLWDTGEITEIGECAPPAQPSRIDSLTVVEPGKIKRGKGGTQVHTVSLRGVRDIELINKQSFYDFL